MQSKDLIQITIMQRNCIDERILRLFLWILQATRPNHREHRNNAVTCKQQRDECVTADGPWATAASLTCTGWWLQSSPAIQPCDCAAGPHEHDCDDTGRDEYVAADGPWPKAAVQSLMTYQSYYLET